MNINAFLITLVVLTVMHYIGDFMTPHRGLDRTSWKTILLSEYVLVLNPLHALWDAYSPFRKHPSFILAGMTRDVTNDGMYIGKIYDNEIEGHPGTWVSKNAQLVILDRRFWIWLGVDQLYHMLTNVALALLMGVLL